MTAVTDGQVWRLLTPIFLHFGIVHLAFNLLVLSWLGNMVESRRGALKLVLFGLPSLFYLFSFIDLWKSVHKKPPVRPRPAVVAWIFLAAMLP